MWKLTAKAVNNVVFRQKEGEPACVPARKRVTAKSSYLQTTRILKLLLAVAASGFDLIKKLCCYTGVLVKNHLMLPAVRRRAESVHT